jgi:hypothetical protein
MPSNPKLSTISIYRQRQHGQELQNLSITFNWGKIWVAGSSPAMESFGEEALRFAMSRFSRLSM